MRRITRTMSSARTSISKIETIVSLYYVYCECFQIMFILKMNIYI